MAYQALYRKFRPKDFSDVKGQDHIVTTLKNQIKANRIGHAYLFCGTRGTGKTTVAKVLGKAVNCENPIDGDPCNECLTCNNINSETSINVIEIDAASNNGVDNIRELKEEVRYSPAQGKYKVYIIDEVHMLSTSAFNALLKTLEEPPSYIIFILATTEPHKLPLTILSRCQRYDFKRISIDTIGKRIAEVLMVEKIEAEDKAINYIARVADGSMRDALSLLDQCISFLLGEKLTYDKVLDVLGAVEIEVYSTLLGYIIEQRPSKCIEFLDEIIIEGKELTRFVDEFTWYLRNLLLYKSSEENLDKIDISSEDIPILKEQGQKIDMNTIVRYIHVFSELSNDIKYSSQKRVLVEVALIQLMTPQMDTDYQSLLDRVRTLENQIQEGIVVEKTNNNPTNVERQDKPTKTGQEQETEKLKEIEKAIPEDLKLIGKNWKSIVMRVPPSWRPHLANTTPRAGSNNSLLITCIDDADLKRISTKEHIQELKEAIADVMGKEIELDIELKLYNNNQGNNNEFPDLTKLIKNFPVEFVD